MERDNAFTSFYVGICVLQETDKFSQKKIEKISSNTEPAGIILKIKCNLLSEVYL